MNTLIENIVHEEIKALLNENLTEKLYHFTDVNSALNIMQRNEMFLTSVYEGVGKHEMFSNKLFYMCFTRERARVGGYGLSCKKRVRIEFDGNKLRQNFSGRPIDFFSEQGVSARGFYMGLDKIPYRQPDVESEDRLFSDKAVIRNVKKYIKRIDVFIGLENRNYCFSTDELKDALRMCDTEFSDILYFYNNIHDFVLQTKNTYDINQSDLTVDRQREELRNEKQKEEDDKLKEKNKYIINNSIESVMLKYIIDVLLNFYRYDIKNEKLIQNPNYFFMKLFKKFGFDEYINYIDEYDFNCSEKIVTIHESVRNVGRLDKERKIYTNFCRMIRFLFRMFKINNEKDLEKQWRN